MITHDLKTWPAVFAATLAGRKPFEIRRDDRGYEAGDVLRLREWDPEREQFTGREVWRTVTYVMRLADVPGGAGLAEGYCLLGLACPVSETLLATKAAKAAYHGALCLGDGRLAEPNWFAVLVDSVWAVERQGEDPIAFLREALLQMQRAYASVFELAVKALNRTPNPPPIETLDAMSGIDPLLRGPRPEGLRGSRDG